MESNNTRRVGTLSDSVTIYSEIKVVSNQICKKPRGKSLSRMSLNIVTDIGDLMSESSRFWVKVNVITIVGVDFGRQVTLRIRKRKNEGTPPFEMSCYFVS